MNESFRNISQPFMRPKAEEEKKEGKFDRSVDMISGGFFDDFVRENIDHIHSRNFGIVKQNLAAGINKLVGEAVKEKGEEFAILLERYLFDDLTNYRYIIPDEENDSLVKEQAEQGLLMNLKDKGVLIEEEQL